MIELHLATAAELDTVPEPQGVKRALGRSLREAPHRRPEGGGGRR